MRYGYEFGNAGMYQTVGEWLLPVRMPLFSAISGLILALTAKDFTRLDFLKHKAKRLLIPFYTLGSLQFIATYIFHKLPLTPHDLFLHLFEGRLRFYFLMAIFSIFVMVFILGKLQALKKIWAIPVIIAILMALTTLPHIPLFALSHAFYLGIFFFLGFGLGKFHKTLICPSGILIAAVIGIGFGCWNGLYGDATDPRFRYGFPVIILSLALTYLILSASLKLDFQNRLFAKIGNYSFGIYLLHGFFLPLVDRGLYALNINALTPHIILATVLCTFGSICLQEILAIWRWPRLILFGGGVPKSNLGRLYTQYSHQIRQRIESFQ